MTTRNMKKNLEILTVFSATTWKKMSKNLYAARFLIMRNLTLLPNKCTDPKKKQLKLYYEMKEIEEIENNSVYHNCIIDYFYQKMTTINR